MDTLKKWLSAHLYVTGFTLFTVAILASIPADNISADWRELYKFTCILVKLAGLLCLLEYFRRNKLKSTAKESD